MFVLETQLAVVLMHTLSFFLVHISLEVSTLCYKNTRQRYLFVFLDSLTCVPDIYLFYRYEALCLVCLYILYIIMMYFNTTLEAWVLAKFQCCADTKKKTTDDIVLYDKLTNGQTSNGSVHANNTDPEGKIVL